MKKKTVNQKTKQYIRSLNCLSLLREIETWSWCINLRRQKLTKKMKNITWTEKRFKFTIMLNISELSLVQNMFRLKYWRRLTSGGFHTNNLHFLNESSGSQLKCGQDILTDSERTARLSTPGQGQKTFPVLVDTVYTSLQ